MARYRNVIKKHFPAILLSALLAGALFWVFSQGVDAFTGPSQPAGQGPGAIGVDSAQNLSVGTNTPLPDTKFLIEASSTGDPSNYSLKVLFPDASPIFVINNNGWLGVATDTPSSTERMYIKGDIIVDGTINGATISGNSVSGPVPAGNITPGVFGSLQGGGNYAFPQKLGINTNTQAGLPQPLSVYGGAYLQGFVGVATQTPAYELDVNGTTRTKDLILTDGVNGITFPDGTHQTSAAAPDNDWIISGNQMYSTGTVSYVGINTTNPAAALDVAGKIAINGTARIAVPDQTTFEGTIYIGNGGSASLSHNAGNDGGRNTLVGIASGNSMTTGDNNTAVGYIALSSNTTGDGNTGLGSRALYYNSTGYSNVAVGINALYFNTTGYDNVGVGASALYKLATGAGNVGVGSGAVHENDNGDYNVGIGQNALYHVLGNRNVGIGSFALNDETGGNNNTAIGYNTGRGITTGSYNTIIGANVTGLPAGLSNTIIIADGQGNQRIYVDSAGNTGLGTTSPSYKLDLAGALRLQPGSQPTGANGVMYYDSTSNKFRCYENGAWKDCISAGGGGGGDNDWTISGNQMYSTGTVSYVGINTTNPAAALDIGGALAFSGTKRIYFPNQGSYYGTMFVGSGGSSGMSLGATDNTFVGINAGTSLTNGLSNTGVGSSALTNVRSATDNVAVGASALYSDSTGAHNVAVGSSALFWNNTGHANVAVGKNALYNSNSSQNVAVGYATLYDLTTGTDNTAIGYNTGRGITTGSYNTIIGANVTGLPAGLSNTIIIADGQGNQRIYVDSAGNTGLGTTSPGYKLDIKTATDDFGWRHTDGTVGIGSYIGSNQANTRSGGWIGTISNHPLYFYTNNSWEQMTLDTNGNFGIGVESPSYKLDLAGALRLQPGSQPTGANGVMYYDSTSNKFRCYENGAWKDCISAGGGGGGGTDDNDWIISGNQMYSTGTVSYVGINTTNPAAALDVAGKIAINGTARIAVPDQTNYTGTMFIGSGGSAGLSHTTGNEGQQNVAIGIGAGTSLTTGSWNTALGSQALSSLTTGVGNVAVGYNAFSSNTGGIRNVAIGKQALRDSTSGDDNTAVGADALFASTSGIRNSALGSLTLADVTSGQNNTAIGYNTGRGITTGSYNTIIGANVTGLPAGLSNTIIIADGQGNQRIYVDSAGNTGLGTTSPSYKLDLAGALRLQPGSQPTGANGVMYYDSTSNKFRCYENGAWKDCISAGGGGGGDNDWTISGTQMYANTSVTSVGIGTTNPASASILHLANDGDTQLRIESASNARFDAPNLYTKRARGTIAAPAVVQDSDFLLDLSALGYEGSTYYRAGEITVAVDGTPSGNRVPSKITFSTADTTNGLQKRFVIRSDGKVGVGTTTPSEALHIETGGNDTTKTGILVSLNGKEVARLKSGSYNYAQGVLELYNNSGALKTKITSDHGYSFFNGAHVGIGTANPAAYRLEVMAQTGDSGAIKASAVSSGDDSIVVSGYLVIDTISGAGPPPSGDCTVSNAGRMKFNVTDNNLYICNGSTWIAK